MTFTTRVTTFEVDARCRGGTTTLPAGSGRGRRRRDAEQASDQLPHLQPQMREILGAIDRATELEDAGLTAPTSCAQADVAPEAANVRKALASLRQLIGILTMFEYALSPGAASMSKKNDHRVIKVLLVGLLPVLWTVGWAFASRAMFKSAEDRAREDVALTALPTRVEPGHDVLLEVTAPRGPVVRSLQTQTDCVSAMTTVSLSTPYTDSGGRTQWKSVTVAKRWVGPEMLTFATNDGPRIDVPAAAGHDGYRNLPYYSVVSEIPARFGISDEELASAHERLGLSGKGRLEVSEWLLPPGARMVLVARLAPHEDRFVASPSETLGRIVLAPANSAADFLAARRGESGSTRTGGWVFAGVAALPALVALVVLAVRRRRNGSEAPESASVKP